MLEIVVEALRRRVPLAARQRLLERRQRARRWAYRLRRPAVLGTLRRTTPLSTHWGAERGAPIDRFYIEGFLEAHRADVRGRVLEIKGSEYTDRYGSGVTERDVLDIDPRNAAATIVADLADGENIPSNTFDCFILTQTLQFIPDVQAAIRTAHRVLRPGGVLLVTVPAVSKTDRLVDYWRFTGASCVWLFGAVFGAGQVNMQEFGNVLTSVAFLVGMAQEELSTHELREHDPHFPVVVGVRAVKQDEP